jgi:hypothetical protein
MTRYYGSLKTFMNSIWCQTNTVPATSWCLTGRKTEREGNNQVTTDSETCLQNMSEIECYKNETFLPNLSEIELQVTRRGTWTCAHPHPSSSSSSPFPPKKGAKAESPFFQYIQLVVWQFPLPSHPFHYPTHHLQSFEVKSLLITVQYCSLRSVFTLTKRIVIFFFK